MKIKLFAYAGLMWLALFSASCTKNNPEPDPTLGLTKIASGYATGASTKVEIYTDNPGIITGFNNLFVVLYDSTNNTYLDKAQVLLTPMMDMGMMSHTAPFENPASENANNHLFACNVMFIMPSTAGTWSLNLEIRNRVANSTGTIKFPITVTDPVKQNMASFKNSADGASYFIAMVQPAKPKIGINDFEMVVYRKASMMSFPADSSYNISIEPEMPTMGHGSPNNVNPVHIHNGHYRGKVNFTMTGFWRIHLNFQRNGAVVDSTKYVDLEF